MKLPKLLGKMVRVKDSEYLRDLDLVTQLDINPDGSWEYALNSSAWYHEDDLEYVREPTEKDFLKLIEDVREEYVEYSHD